MWIQQLKGHYQNLEVIEARANSPLFIYPFEMACPDELKEINNSQWALRSYCGSSNSTGIASNLMKMASGLIDAPVQDMPRSDEIINPWDNFSHLRISLVDPTFARRSAFLAKQIPETVVDTSNNHALINYDNPTYQTAISDLGLSRIIVNLSLAPTTNAAGVQLPPNTQIGYVYEPTGWISSDWVTPDWVNEGSDWVQVVLNGLSANCTSLSIYNSNGIMMYSSNDTDSALYSGNSTPSITVGEIRDWFVNPITGDCFQKDPQDADSQDAATSPWVFEYNLFSRVGSVYSATNSTGTIKYFNTYNEAVISLGSNLSSWTVLPVAGSSILVDSITPGLLVNWLGSWNVAGKWNTMIIVNGKQGAYVPYVINDAVSYKGITYTKVSNINPTMTPDISADWVSNVGDIYVNSTNGKVYKNLPGYDAAGNLYIFWSYQFNIKDFFTQVLTDTGITYISNWYAPLVGSSLEISFFGDNAFLLPPPPQKLSSLSGDQIFNYILSTITNVITIDSLDCYNWTLQASNSLTSAVDPINIFDYTNQSRSIDVTGILLQGYDVFTLSGIGFPSINNGATPASSTVQLSLGNPVHTTMVMR
jgi:hypothetical protein